MIQHSKDSSSFFAKFQMENSWISNLPNNFARRKSFINSKKNIRNLIYANFGKVIMRFSMLVTVD